MDRIQPTKKWLWPKKGEVASARFGGFFPRNMGIERMKTGIRMETEQAIRKLDDDNDDNNDDDNNNNNNGLDLMRERLILSS